jgi:hypothetical protein
MTSKGCRRHFLHEFSAQLKCTFNQRMANAICALPEDNRCHVVQGTAASMRLVQVSLTPGRLFNGDTTYLRIDRNGAPLALVIQGFDHFGCLKVK